MAFAPTRSTLSLLTTPLIYRPRFSCSALPNCKHRRAYTSVLIVPTGVGASIGGFAGDALPVARGLAAVADCVISHPNVLNAAMLYWPMPNVLYVEGYALDRFAEGSWALQPVHQNKVGLVLDAGMEEELRLRHLQVADAARASLGLPLLEYVITDVPLEKNHSSWALTDLMQSGLSLVLRDVCHTYAGALLTSLIALGSSRAPEELVEMWIDPNYGHSTGRINHPDSLLRAVSSLVDRCEVNAVAVVARFPDDDFEEMEDYRQGKGLDILAGVEAVISHLVVKEFQIPCAHAPAVLPAPLMSLLSPRSAAEEIGHTFLPCVLSGLSTAPQYVTRKMAASESGCIFASEVDSVILPRDACGGEGALAFATKLRNKPLIIVVQENETVLRDTPDKLKIEAMKVSNYWEALGVVAAHKAGVNPNALRRDGIANIKYHCTTRNSEPYFKSVLRR